MYAVTLDFETLLATSAEIGAAIVIVLRNGGVASSPRVTTELGVS